MNEEVKTCIRQYEVCLHGIQNCRAEMDYLKDRLTKQERFLEHRLAELRGILKRLKELEEEDHGD